MPIAALAIARRFWPALAIAAVLLSLWLWGNHREGQGIAQERASWQAAGAELLALRQADKDRAETKDTSRRAATERKLAPIRERTNRYVETAPDCPDDAGRRLLNEAIAATHPDTAATGRGGVPGAAPVG